MNIFSSNNRVVTTTQRMSEAPWKEQVPHLQFSFEEAKKIYKSKGPSYFPEQTVVPFASETETYLTKQKERAIKGSLLTEKAKDNIAQILSYNFETQHPCQTLFNTTAKGTYVEKNMVQTLLEEQLKDIQKQKSPALDVALPYLDKNYLNNMSYAQQMYDQWSQKVASHYRRTILPQIHSQFAKNGRYGSKTHQEMLQHSQNQFIETLSIQAKSFFEKQRMTQEKTQLEAAKLAHHATYQNQQDIHYITSQLHQNYARERLHQLNASSQISNMFQQFEQLQLLASKLSPFLEQQDYFDLDQLAKVGGIRESLAQNQLNDEVQRWNFKNNLEANKLAQYLGLIGGGYGGESLSSQTQPHYRSNEGGDILSPLLQKTLLDFL